MSKNKFPEKYQEFYDEIRTAVEKSGYKVKTSMDNLIINAIAYFDNEDNYGEYDPETCRGGFGDGFTVSGLLDFVDASGGWENFDHTL